MVRGRRGSWRLRAHTSENEKVPSRRAGPALRGRLALERNGAQGRICTADTRIFSPLLYSLSYLGPWVSGLAAILALPPRFGRLAGRSKRPRQGRRL